MNNDLDSIISRLRGQLSPQEHICSSCGYEHNCSRDGCRVIRDAIECLSEAQSQKLAMVSKLDTMTEIMKYYQEQATYRGKCLAKERARLDLAIADLRASALCETCFYTKTSNDTACESVDYACKICPDQNCACWSCHDGSQWQWKGDPAKALINPGRIESLNRDIFIKTHERKPIPVDWVREYNSLLHQISDERGAKKCERSNS